MLDGRTGHVGPGLAGQHPPDGGVDGLGPAGGEDHLAGSYTEQRRHPVACVLEGRTDHAPLGVYPSGVGGHAEVGPLGHGGAGLGS